MALTVLSHDGFARQELVRDTDIACACSYCGTTKRPNGAPRRTFYIYGTRHDDNARVNWHRGQFCSKACHDNYHGT